MADKNLLIVSHPTDFKYYPSSQKTTPQKIIGIISIVAITVFFSIASFYNAQLSFAIINTCFFTLLGSAIIYSLIFPTPDLLSNPNNSDKAYRGRAFSCPVRRRSAIIEGGADGIVFPRPRGPEYVHFASPLGKGIPPLETTHRGGKIFSRRKTHL